MFDVEISAVGGAAGLARIGQVLGEAGIGLEGGGMWSDTAHYLVVDGRAASRALAVGGVGPVTVRPAVVMELDADVPGALGRLMARLSAGGVEVQAQYSDHDNRKVLVVADPDRARKVLGR